jgi:hypothetical protein
MNRLEDSGTVLSHSLIFTQFNAENGQPKTVHLAGQIDCANGVALDVNKWLAVRRSRRGRYEVRGVSYSYHAWLRESELDLLRYDTSHGMGELHRHFFDDQGREVEVRPIVLADLPTLTGVIEEAVGLAALLK